MSKQVFLLDKIDKRHLSGTQTPYWSTPALTSTYKSRVIFILRHHVWSSLHTTL